MVEPKHIVCTEKETLSDIKISIAKIETKLDASIKTFYDHIAQGKGWRFLMASIGLGLVGSIITFAMMFGVLSKTVEVNERIILRILDKYEHLDIDSKKNG
jgi:hypothetical protein